MQFTVGSFYHINNWLAYVVSTLLKKQSCKQAIYAFAEGDELCFMMLGLKRFTKIDPFNLKEARRKVASHAIAKREYPF